MTVEGGTVSAGSGGPSVGGVGVSAGLAVGAPGGEFGPGAGIGSTIVNEGPVAPAFLENTMPLTFNKPLGEISFNPFKGGEIPSEPVSVIQQAVVPSGTRQAEQVAAKAWELPLASPGETLEASGVGLAVNSLVRTPEPAIVRLPNPARGLDVRVITNPFLAPKVETAPQRMAQNRVESRVINRVASMPSIYTHSQAQTEQVVEEKLQAKEKKEDKAAEKNSEEQSVAKIKIVEAVKVTQLRRSAVYEAARQVKEEAEKMGEKVVITAKKLKKFLSGEFWKYISPLVGKEGHDGTIALTLHAIENNRTEYTSLEQAQTELSKPVTEHIPLERGEGSRVATVDEVREVLEGKEKENFRSNTPAEIIIRRVMRKNVEVVEAGQKTTVVEKKEEEERETSLKDFPTLAEVFQKAA